MSLQKKLQILDNKIQLNSILYCEKLFTYLSYTTHLSKKIRFTDLLKNEK